jgi:hypothetical protein
VNGRKIVLLLLIGFLVFFVFNSPADAAAVVKNAQHVLGHLFSSISTFVDSFRS